MLFVGAQAAIALFKLMTRWPHSLQPEGFFGMTLATGIFIVGFEARIWSASWLKVGVIVAGD